MSDTTNGTQLLELTAKIVSAHVSNNAIQADALPALIQSVFRTLTGVETAPQSGPAPTPEPAVPVKRSIFPGYLVCLEDGKKLKMLKRHLASAYQMTPSQYRERWGLPASYPMVAPEYAARRSVLAKQIGLGRISSTPAEAPKAPPLKAKGKTPGRKRAAKAPSPE